MLGGGKLAKRPLPCSTCPTLMPQSADWSTYRLVGATWAGQLSSAWIPTTTSPREAREQAFNSIVTPQTRMAMMGAQQRLKEALYAIQIAEEQLARDAQAVMGRETWGSPLGRMSRMLVNTAQSNVGGRVVFRSLTQELSRVMEHHVDLPIVVGQEAERRNAVL